MQVKTAIIGAGRNRNGIGKYIARYFHENGAVIASVLGSTEETAKRAVSDLKEYGIAAAAYTDLDTLLKLEQPDAVIIASPSETHEVYLARCIEYGAHVFCEKPFVAPDGERTASVVDPLFTAARKKNAVIAMNSQWVFSLPYYEKLCGPMVKERLETFSIRMSPSCSGKEMVPDSVPHALSILYQACGTGSLAGLKIEAHDDSMRISFQYVFSGGAVNSVLDFVREEIQPRTFSFGFNEAVVTRKIDPESYAVSFTYGGQVLNIPDPLELSVQDFLAAVKEGRAPLAGRDHVCETQNMLDVIYGECARLYPEKLKNREYDFSAKLRQAGIIDRFKTYVTWQRGKKSAANGVTCPDSAPVSINLDLTSACNYACPHCVDAYILNGHNSLDKEEVKRSLDILCSRGLLSVILIGGGEPTLHKDFEEIVTYIKEKGLQLGIVTNGSRLEKIKRVALLFEKGDWLRLSLDAARQETFEKMHCPKIDISLEAILKNAKMVKEINPDISLGSSFVIVWKGVVVQGNELASNLEEIQEFVLLAKKYGFDFVSFKPCLVRLEDTHKESLLESEDSVQEMELVRVIKKNMTLADEAATGSLKVLKSVNLQAMMDNRVADLKHQPAVCHMQLFNTVLSPAGIFHCPAFRGVDKARVAGADGYTEDKKFNAVLNNTYESLDTFKADQECSVVGCFYHHVNWWIDDFIRSGKDVDSLEAVKNDNFFL